MRKAPRPCLSFLLAPALLLGACAHIGERTARDSFVAETRRIDLSHAPLALRETSALKGADSERIRDNAECILTLLFEKRRSGIRNPSQELRVRVRLKEDSFVRDFRTLNTVSAEVSLFEEEDPRPIAIFIESEDTEETLSSYAYLHALLGRMIGRIE